MRFFNKSKEVLQANDSGGAIVLGPFLPGTAEKGPWYDVSTISDYYLELWTDKGKIEIID